MTDPQDPDGGPSPVAGGCVAVTLGGGALGALFALAPEAGALTVWAVSGTALWWAARRPTSAPSTPPPPAEAPLSRDEEAGHSDGGPVVIERQAGMSIIRDTREHRHYTTRCHTPPVP